jgi:hypothetical protein
MSRIVTDVVSLDVFKGMVAYYWSKHSRFGEYLSGKPVKGMDPVEFLKYTNFGSELVSLTPKVASDLSKVQFDTENFEWENGEGFDGLESITGFYVLPNGLAGIGFCSGGDWESPL